MDEQVGEEERVRCGDDDDKIVKIGGLFIPKPRMNTIPYQEQMRFQRSIVPWQRPTARIYLNFPDRERLGRTEVVVFPEGSREAPPPKIRLEIKKKHGNVFIYFSFGMTTACRRAV